MNIIIILGLIFLIIAILLQMVGGFINATQNDGINIRIMNTDLQITSEHMWQDSIFMMLCVILLAIIYLSKKINK